MHFDDQTIGADGDRSEDLKRLYVPAVVVHGADDPLVMPIGGELTAQAIPGAELRIAAPDDSICAQGETGEIQLRAPYLMSGYFQNPQATAEAFTADGFLRTGDLGLIREVDVSGEVG